LKKPLSHKWYKDLNHEWLSKVRFVDTHVNLLLRDVLAKPAVETARPKAWVFDLDSTLFCIAPRMRSIFFEFLRHHPNAPSLWLRSYDFFKPEVIQYDFEKTFASIFRYLTGDVTESQNQAKILFDEYYPFWLEHFYHDRHLRFDVPYPGAVDFVKRVRQSGRAIVYMTGRDRPGTGQGTLEGLKISGFEISPQDKLVMKSVRGESDVLFKERAILAIASQYEVELCIDNEPENLVMFAKRLPHAEVVFFHSVMSHRLPNDSLNRVLGTRSAWRVDSFF
jgi:hypothetical protein